MRKAGVIALIVVGYLALREVMAHLWWRLPNPTDSALPFYLIWTPPCVVAIRLWGSPRWWPERARWTSPWTWLVVAGVIAYCDVLYGGSLVRALLGKHWYQWPANAALFINGAIAAPLFEELIFRGILWDAIAKRSKTIVAVVLTSVLFGLWHNISVFELSWRASITGAPLIAHIQFGIAMAALRWRLGAIVPGMIVHGVFNALVLIVSRG